MRAQTLSTAVSQPAALCSAAVKNWSKTINRNKFELLNYLKDGYAFNCSLEAFDQLREHNANSHFIAALGIFEGNRFGLVLYPLSADNTIPSLEQYPVLWFQKTESPTVFFSFVLDTDGIVLNENFQLEEKFEILKSNRMTPIEDAIGAEIAVAQIQQFKQFKVEWLSNTEPSQIVRQFRVPFEDLSGEFMAPEIESVRVLFGFIPEQINGLLLPDLLFVADQSKEHAFKNLVQALAETNKASSGNPFAVSARNFTTPCPPFCVDPDGLDNDVV